MTRTGEAIPTLVMIYEPEAACRERLAAEGFAPERAIEISSYLAQSTDLSPCFGAIEQACTAYGIAFATLPLDDAPGALPGFDPASTLVWTLTDGIAYFRGSAAPALARLAGLRRMGAEDSVFALCQDKFRSGAVLAALGLPVPPAGLARGGDWIVPPPSAASYFVKPNRLGAKIGIFPDSHCRNADEALTLSRRIHDLYRDDAIVQAYVPGRNVRASFLAVAPEAGIEALGSVFVDSGGDFQTMQESLALYGESGAAARKADFWGEPELVSVAATNPVADPRIRRMAAQAARGLGLRDVFSLDLRLEESGRLHLLEFEICPGLPCFDFRAYCRAQWGLPLEEAIAAAAAARLKAP